MRAARVTHAIKLEYRAIILVPGNSYATLLNVDMLDQLDHSSCIICVPSQLRLFCALYLTREDLVWDHNDLILKVFFLSFWVIKKVNKYVKQKKQPLQLNICL